MCIVYQMLDHMLKCVGGDARQVLVAAAGEVTV